MVFNLLSVPLSTIRPNDGLLNTLILTSRGRVQSFISKTVVIKARKEQKFEVDGTCFEAKSLTSKYCRKPLPLF